MDARIRKQTGIFGRGKRAPRERDHATHGASNNGWRKTDRFDKGYERTRRGTRDRTCRKGAFQTQPELIKPYWVGMATID